MLVSALAGRENILNAYNEAVKGKIQIFSLLGMQCLYTKKVNRLP